MKKAITSPQFQSVFDLTFWVLPRAEHLFQCLLSKYTHAFGQLTKPALSKDIVVNNAYTNNIDSTF